MGASNNSVTPVDRGEKNGLTDQEKLAKRRLRLAVFWRSFLFWMSFPLGCVISYFFQPEFYRDCTTWAHYLDEASPFVLITLPLVLISILSLFTGETDNVLFDIPYHSRVVVVTILVTMVVCIVIGGSLVWNVKRALSLELPKGKVVEITERVEQGLLYMRKDSDTFWGSAKRQLKQLVRGLGILALAVVAAIIVSLIGFCIVR